MVKEEETKQMKTSNIVIGAFGSAEKDCIGIVENIATPESGGIFTKYMGCKYLFKGYPEQKILDYIYASKRVLVGFFQLIRNKPIKFLLSICFLLYLIMPKGMKRKVVLGLLDYFLGITHWVEYKYVYALSTERYCKTVKEVHRVSEIILNDIDEEMRKRLSKFRDVICIILEMDYAYRARFQDILPLLDKQLLKENPKRELKRLTDIFLERENLDGENAMTDKWTGLQKMLMISLKFKGVRNIILKILLEIDSKEIERDEADYYFVLNRSDYMYNGETYEDRMEKLNELNKGMSIPKVIIKNKDEPNTEKLS
jgi:hypothetical protein